MGPDDTEEYHGQGDSLPLKSHPITIACCNQHLHQFLTSRLSKKCGLVRSILYQYDFLIATHTWQSNWKIWPHSFAQLDFSCCHTCWCQGCQTYGICNVKRIEGIYKTYYRTYFFSPINLDELLEEHNSSRTVAFCIKWRRPGCKSHHIWDDHQYWRDY